MKILGIDFGTRRTGLAFADSRDGLIFARRPLHISNRTALAGALADLVKEEAVEVAVFGLPGNKEDHETEICRRVRNVAADMATLAPVKVCFVDERLTSFEAASRLRQGGLKGRRLTAAIDSEAAVLILEFFLKNNMEPEI